MPYSYICSCSCERWNPDCDVNYLLRHVQFLGTHHHEGVAETSDVSLKRVKWHDQHVQNSGAKAIDFDLDAGPRGDASPK